MAKLTYKGTGRPCATERRGQDGAPLGHCPNQASRGSDYCLACKHRRQARGKPVGRR